MYNFRLRFIIKNIIDAMLVMLSMRSILIVSLIIICYCNTSVGSMADPRVSHTVVLIEQG